MRLTPQLVARIAPYAGDPPPLPGIPPTDADFQEAVRELLQTAPSPQDVWLFAYGSLLWKPACEAIDRQTGTLLGWHRSFCLGWDRWFRGSEQFPGLMLSLDRGGQCRGAVYRLPPDAVEANLEKLLRREMRIKPAAHVPRWVKVKTADGPLPAIAFVINRKSDRYISGLSLDEIVNTLATAAGPVGTMAEYLHSTVSHLEALGLHDSHLWHLQELVAQRIEALHDSLAPLGAREFK
jgi:cation transport protein ChaC